MSRKRIVIDLDAPVSAGSPASAESAGRAASGRAKKSRRWPKVLGVLFVLALVVIGVVAIAGFFVWRHYQSTPTYALSLMIDAAQRGDVAEFQKRLDDDEIAKNMVGRVSEKAAARYGLALSTTVKQQIDSTMPSVLQEIKPAIHDEVAKEIQAFASKSKPQPFILLLLAVPSLMTITTEGDTARATGLLNDRRFEIVMKRADDGWRVTDFKDDVVVQRIVDRVMPQLPAVGQLESKLPLVKPSKRTRRR
ncbi:MAG TPA: hypothetical protein VFR51_18090 [Pyrinomonadaceae bacterium]|nr:hypothetical protein [Pyrinomonadaceae bacterium]